jgi:hypothetical protein
LTALPARVTAVENGKAVKGANGDITSLTGLTTALSIAQGGTGGNTPDTARAALGVPGRNRIINGACLIAQRASAAFATGAGGYAGPDRFFATNSGTAGGQFTQSQGTIVDGNVTKLAIVQTVNTAIVSTSGVNYWSGILQYIEGFNCFDLAGSPVALSFLFKTNVTGTFSVAVRDSTGSVSYNTSFAAVSGVTIKVTINLPAVPVGAVIPTSNATGMTVTVGSINTGTFQAPSGGVWNTGNYITVPSSVNWGATAGNYISLTDLQFEAGTATPFERRSITHETSMCQRYYGTGGGVIAGYNVGGSNIGNQVEFKSTMRAVPTMGITGSSLANMSAAGASNPAPNGFTVYGTVTATGNASLSHTWTASAEL